ncbi:unnamed protein product [Phaeothamnion confervicola]
MPSEYGLYTSLMPPFLYMLMGTCQQMSFGVTAIESILVRTNVRRLINASGGAAQESCKNPASQPTFPHL